MDTTAQALLEEKRLALTAPSLEHRCEICKDRQWLRLDAPPGHPDFGKLVPCACYREEYEARKMKRLARIAGLWPSELALRLKDMFPNQTGTAAMVEQARRFAEEPGGFFTVWGGVGNGKSMVLMALMNELRERHGLPGRYVVLTELIDCVRDGYNTNADLDARRRLEELREIPVLAIDAVEALTLTPYAEEIRCRLLDRRYRLATLGQAHTLFAMNIDPAGLPDHLYDRMRDDRFVIVHNGDPSMRPVMGAVKER
jgi:DNA replication protein DnaC